MDNTKEYIVCAAVWYKDQRNEAFPHQPENITRGFVVCGLRHHNCITTAKAILKSTMPEHEQGFLTSKNRFVSREEAAKIVVEVGQVTELKHSKTRLYSEDLY